MTGQVKAGWYPHAAEEHWLQWWDGKQWIEAYWPTRIPARPYLPDAERVDISIEGEPRFDIVGENYREAEILAAIDHEATPRDIEFEGEGVAELVPEPDNPHDSGAISVRIAGYNVGYFSAEHARLYRNVIGRFVTAGLVPTTRVRIWGVTRWIAARNRDELKSAIRLALPAPDEIVPANEPPAAPYFLIPKGRSIQVTGEEKHLERLTPLVSLGGRPVIATLHPVDGKSRGSTVLEVRIDGGPVGQLTPGTSTSLMPLVRESEKEGRIAAVWATVSGSRLAAEVKLRAIRAEEVPPEWPRESDVLARVGELDSPPPAYSPQIALTRAPLARGLETWMWIATSVVAVIFLLVPYVGWLLAAALFAGATWWHFVRLKRAPTERYPAPRF